MDDSEAPSLVDRTVAACIVGNYAVFAAMLVDVTGSVLQIALLLVVAGCLGFSMSGPLLRYVVARWMLGARGDTLRIAYSIAPVLLHAGAACIVWAVWHTF